MPTCKCGFYNRSQQVVDEHKKGCAIYQKLIKSNPAMIINDPRTLYNAIKILGYKIESQELKNNNIYNMWKTVRDAYENDKTGGHGSSPDSGYYKFENSEMPVKEFLGLRDEEQISIINGIWKCMVEQVRADTLAENMYEPAQNKINKAFTTSNYEKFAWNKHRIGFRCDSRPPGDVQKQGFKPLYWDQTRSQNDGQYVFGTIMSTPNMPIMFIWRGNRDAVGETCVCVSRTFLGSTKFPFPTATTAQDKKFHIWALDVNGLLGYDLETWQMRSQSGTLWRPGEKMFPSIDTNRVLAYVEVIKHGSDESGGWKFEILPSADWNWVNQQRLKKESIEYMKTELYDLRGQGVYTVSSNMDFGGTRGFL